MAHIQGPCRLYVENGTVFVDLNSFALSCADGPFFPVPVPPALIGPAFAASLAFQ